MAITKLTSDSIREPGPDNTLMGKVNELVNVANGTTALDALNTSGQVITSNVLFVDPGANQNDWAPTGIATSSVIRLAPTGIGTITGIIAPAVDGTHLWLTNTGAVNITLSHESTSSAAANRFRLRGAADLVLTPHAGCHLIYTGTRWRDLGVG